MGNRIAQADPSNRSRLTEQKEHTEPRCPYRSVLRARLSHTGALGLMYWLGVGWEWNHSHSHPSSKQVLTFQGLTGGTGHECPPPIDLIEWGKGLRRKLRSAPGWDTGLKCEPIREAEL